MGQVINFTVIMCTWASYEIRTFHFYTCILYVNMYTTSQQYMYAYSDDED